MSTDGRHDFEVAVVGAGVVGCAVALALARRSVSVALLEAESEPGLCASGTNSGIVHTGFDSIPGELETELILRSAALRETVVDALGIPMIRCGAVLRPRDETERQAVAALARGAARNGVTSSLRPDGTLQVPGEAITDPVAFTLALAAAAARHGATLRTHLRVTAIEDRAEWLRLSAADGERIGCRVAVNCTGLRADEVARLAGDDSFSIYPRKGEFLVFAPRAGDNLDRILLPVPSHGTKGVLVFPTIDGMVVAGPTAIDLEDKDDWSVRAAAREEIIAKAAVMHPPLADAEPVFAYAGLRPAGRGVNYVIGPSPVCPRLVNVAAIRSTGLTASLGIAQHVTGIVRSLGARLGSQQTLRGGPVPERAEPWWRRSAAYRAGVAA
jgi:glycerol-3-phosphate dehydrogenase